MNLSFTCPVTGILQNMLLQSMIYISMNTYVTMFLHSYASTSHLRTSSYDFSPRFLQEIRLPYQSMNPLVPLTKLPHLISLSKQMPSFESHMSMLVVHQALLWQDVSASYFPHCQALAVKNWIYTVCMCFKFLVLKIYDWTDILMLLAMHFLICVYKTWTYINHSSAHVCHHTSSCSRPSHLTWTCIAMIIHDYEVSSGTGFTDGALIETLHITRVVHTDT